MSNNIYKYCPPTLFNLNMPIEFFVETNMNQEKREMLIEQLSLIFKKIYVFLIYLIVIFYFNILSNLLKIIYVYMHIYSGCIAISPYFVFTYQAILTRL